MATRFAPSQLIVSLPYDLNEPFRIRAKHKVAGMLLLDRDYANRLAKDWNVPGVYLLLDRPNTEGRWGAYVGKATSPGLRNRVLEQLRERDHWYRALLVRYESNDDHTLNSGEAAWLEGQLYDHLHRAGQVDLRNRNRPQDQTLSDDDETSLIDYLIPISCVLRLIGHTLYPQATDAPDGGGPLIETINTQSEAQTLPPVKVPVPGAVAGIPKTQTLGELQAKLARIRAGIYDDY